MLQPFFKPILKETKYTTVCQSQDLNRESWHFCRCLWPQWSNCNFAIFTHYPWGPSKLARKKVILEQETILKNANLHESDHVKQVRRDTALWPLQYHTERTHMTSLGNFYTLNNIRTLTRGYRVAVHLDQCPTGPVIFVKVPLVPIGIGICIGIYS